MGCHKLRKNVGCRKHIPTNLRLCNMCQVGQPGDEYHLLPNITELFTDVRNKHSSLFGIIAVSMGKYMAGRLTWGCQVCYRRFGDVCNR